MKEIITDCLIVGGGLAGVYTALNLDQSHKVILVTKGEKSNSSLAQGGIAGEMTSDPDVLQAHFEDTLKAGVGLHDEAAVKTLVEEAKANLEKLLALGVPFDVDDQGNIAFTKEAGHRTRRIVHAGGDQTGKVVMDTLNKHLEERPNITILNDYLMYDLIVQDNICYGAQFINHQGKTLRIIAHNTVLATGGIGALYQSSTNAPNSSGDGIAAGIRAGAKVRDLEFVQFHPTVFYQPVDTSPQRFLISEAVRGEGAYLVNIMGERFMKNYDERLELAPRDVVARANYHELQKMHAECVFIDARHLGKDFLKRRFPTIYQKCLVSGYLMEDDLIPVAPAEHFGIGGIQTDLEGRTSIDGLFACGECASTGVHGANRLASNSLLECLVFGKKIAKNINQTNNQKPKISYTHKEYQAVSDNYQEITTTIQAIMTKNVGIIRSQQGLEEARSSVEVEYHKLINNPFYSWEYFQCLNIATVSLAIIQAALARKESIGCHYREN